jgi:hypothetical protein
MRAVPAAEREAALTLLEAARREAMAALRALPLATNTPFRERRRDAADARLAEIDAAVALFSQPVVYLPAETPSVEAPEEQPAQHEAAAPAHAAPWAQDNSDDGDAY